MASVLSSSNLLFSSNLSCCCSSSPSCSGRINAAISVPRIPNIRFAPRKAPITSDLIGEQRITDLGLKSTTQAEKSVPSRRINEQNDESSSSVSMATAQLYAVLEAVSDRVEVHRNIGEQRDNWNTLLLNSINMITLTASAMAGVAATAAVSGEDSSLLALKLSSTLLFSCATAMTIMVNKIQPSQLAEEQRNAVRLFKQIQSRIQTLLSVKVFNEEDVKEITEEVLALDKAYPLPLLGNKMIEKFPKSFTPAVWWPSKNNSKRNQKLNRVTKRSGRNNGWNEELEIEMREVMEVIKNKDAQDYNRLGNMVLKINKILAISGPVLMGIAAVGSGCVGSQHGSMAAVVASAAGSLAAVVNSLEHGGQVGMVVEMYRNCYGMFNHLEESIKSNLNEREFEKRENGEIFEMKVALGLGRSVSGLRDFTRKSRFSRMHGVEIEEFASKLM